MVKVSSYFPFLLSRIIYFLLAAVYVATASVLQILIFFLSIPSTPLNGSFRNFNTWCVSVGNRTLRRDFLATGFPKSGSRKLPIFDDFATQWQCEDQYLRCSDGSTLMRLGGLAGTRVVIRRGKKSNNGLTCLQGVYSSWKYGKSAEFWYLSWKYWKSSEI